jgi:uncharacterized protein YdbL (DUF1318 family)
MEKKILIGVSGLCAVIVAMIVGCRIETVGDPNKPIKIEAHVVVDIRKLKDTAADIEDMVEGKTPAEAAVKPTVWHIIDRVLGVSEAYAEGGYKIKYATPESDKAIESRRARFRALRYLKGEGQVGEGNNGFVVKLGGGGDVQALVDAENHDRGVIYNTIVSQNAMAPADISLVRKTFAQVRRNRAKAGDRIQLDSGEWVTK